MTAAEVKQLLGLTPHPREGGWFIQTYAAVETIAPTAFAAGRYSGPRKTSTAIYYLLDADTFSEMHLLRSDEVFHFYAGDPVEMLQLLPDGSGRTRSLARFAAGRGRGMGFARLHRKSRVRVRGL
jgi:predicted cupin superfamily sugar epimerase